MNTYWLSFAPQSGPARVFLIDATDKIAAHQRIVQMGLLREGDETLILLIPEHMGEHALPRNRELTEGELQSVGAIKLGPKG